MPNFSFIMRFPVPLSYKHINVTSYTHVFPLHIFKKKKKTTLELIYM